MYASSGERAVSALAAFGIVVLIGYALVIGLDVGLDVRAPPTLVSVLIDLPKPQPRKSPKRRVRPARTSAVRGPPAPRNLREQATPIVAPPVPPLIVPPPVATATQGGTGQAVSNGASDLPGPGQGAGGLGNGNGGGGKGTDAEQTRGRLWFKDLPRGLLGPGEEVTVGVHYTVGTDGRVHDCEVSEPSRFPKLNARTCRLIEKRYRFRPALDRAGRPIPSTNDEDQTWTVEKD